MKNVFLLLILTNCFILQAQNFVGDPAEIKAILTKVDSFSAYYMVGNYEALANSYTDDGKILPPGPKVISGREAIEKRWTLPEGMKVKTHQIDPKEIVINGDTAYDWGYYLVSVEEGEDLLRTINGKYVIVWKKVDGEWKIYLDIWNNVN